MDNMDNRDFKIAAMDRRLCVDIVRHWNEYRFYGAKMNLII